MIYGIELVITKEQHKAALLGINLTDNDKAILTTLYYCPQKTASAKDFAVRLGYQSYYPVNGMIGNVGHKFATFLGIESSVSLRNDGTARWFSTIFYASESSQKEHIEWMLREELAVALEELGWVTPQPRERLNETEVGLEPYDPDRTLMEGHCKKISVNIYERNPLARQKCIQHYGTRCRVCNEDLGEKYGAIAAGYIHIHHLVPLSLLDAAYIVDPIRDLRPVCPNCHAIIHRRHPTPFTLEEVQAMLHDQQEKTDDKHPD